MFKQRLSVSLLTWMLAFATLVAPALGQGRQVPPMPKLDGGEEGWLSVGGSPFGLVGVFSHQKEHVVASLVAAYCGLSEELSGGDLGVTVDWLLSRGRLLIAVGGGPGFLLRDPFDPAEKARLGLNADLQIFFRFSPRFGLGLYSLFGVAAHRSVAGVFICLQYGRWKL